MLQAKTVKRRQVGSGIVSWFLLFALVIIANVGLMYTVATRAGALGGRKVQVPLFAAQPGGSFLQIATRLQDLAAADDRCGIALITLPSNGSLENLDHISRLENAISFTFVRLPDYLRRKEQYRDIRAIALLNLDVVQLVATKESGISQATDLAAARGSQPRYRVYVGLSRSGTRETSRELLDTVLGAFHPDWIDRWEEASRNINFEEAAQQLRDGQLDAAIFVTGHGAPAVRQLFEDDPGRFRLVPLSEPVRDRLIRRGYDGLAVPTYDGQANVKTVGARVLVATHKNTQDWIARQFVDLIERHRDELEPLLTRPVTGPPDLPELITNSATLQRVLQDVPLHEGLLTLTWGWARSPWLQIVAFSMFLGTQIFFLLRFRPRSQIDVHRNEEEPTAQQSRGITAPAATIAAATISAAISALASIVVSRLKP
jgi:TRAP transporter TAXI family solute receptor